MAPPPLWLAATHGDAAMIEALLKGGADANEALPLGRRPLMLAARAGNVAAVRALIERGADVNASESERGTTALMQAADQGHAEVVRELIRRGANVAAVSRPVMRDGRTAALGNSEDPRRAVRQQAIAVLCEAKNPDLAEVRRQRELLMGPSQKKIPEADLCKGIERRGLGFVTVSGAGGNAGAGVGGEVVAFQVDADGNLVLDANGDPIPVDTGRGRRAPPREPDGGALTALVYAARTGSIDTARTLLEGGADVNQTTRYGWSPLLAAIQNQNYQMAKFLIERGANVNLANKGGWSPLYLATDNRNIEGGDYPTRTADMDSLEFIAYLLDKGADVNARVTESTETRTVFTNQWLNEGGATAFLRAAQSGDLKLLKLLVCPRRRSEDQHQAGRDAAGGGCRHRLGGRRHAGALHRRDGGDREVPAVARHRPELPGRHRPRRAARRRAQGGDGSGEAADCGGRQDGCARFRQHRQPRQSRTVHPHVAADRLRRRPGARWRAVGDSASGNGPGAARGDAEGRPQGAARRPHARIAVHRRCVQAGIRSDEHQQLIPMMNGLWMIGLK